MADDLIEDEMDEKQEVQEIHRENDASADSGSGKLARIKQLLKDRRRVVIIVSGIMVLILLVCGLLLFLPGSTEQADPGVSNMEAMTDEEIQLALDKEPEIVFEDIVVLDPFERIPLKSSSAMKMISLNLSLELTDHRYRKMVVTVEDRIRKIIQGQVREMTWLELRNPEGKIRLRYELLKRMNSIFPKVTIRNIYFTNFIMQ